MGNAERTNGRTRKKVRTPGSTSKLISSYYLEIEYLLNRVEQSGTHYQVLNLDRAATSEEIVRAYQETVKVLHPDYYKVRAAISDDILERIDDSFGKVSQAFFVLTDLERKSEYDRSLNKQKRNPAINETAPPADRPPAQRVEAGSSAPRPGAVPQEVIVRNCVTGHATLSKPVDNRELANRRRCERFRLALPVMIVGHDRTDGRWQEVAKTMNVSRTGICVAMTRRVEPGFVAHLTLPLPTKLRSHGYSEPGYKAYAIVRRAEPLKDGVRVVGFEFLSEHPPAGYLNEPWASFRTQKWAGADRRREPRVARSEGVMIEYLDENLQLIRQESAVTENVSLHGARLRLRIPAPQSDRVRVIHRGRGFEGIAIVRNRYKGRDGFERLCLYFPDDKWPQ